jgi:hypothetical protein
MGPRSDDSRYSVAELPKQPVTRACPSDERAIAMVYPMRPPRASRLRGRLTGPVFAAIHRSTFSFRHFFGWPCSLLHNRRLVTAPIARSVTKRLQEAADKLELSAGQEGKKEHALRR